jgi:hypothetical protein
MDFSGLVDIFEIVMLYCLDWVMRHFSYQQHIPVDSDMSDALHAHKFRVKMMITIS